MNRILVLAVFAAAAAARAGVVCMDVAGVSSGNNAHYATSSGCPAYAPGLVFNNTTGARLNPANMPAGMTTAGFALSDGTGTEYAFASLEQGVLRDSVDAGVGFRGIAQSEFLENLHFHTTDGAPSAVVDVHVHLDGSTTALGYGNQFIFSMGGAAFSYGMTSNPPAFGESQVSGWQTFSFTNKSATGFDFDGTLIALDGGAFGTQVSLVLDCTSGGCAFDHTAILSLGLPSNLTFTSDSGVFLTQSVPEPATLSLMVGVALLLSARLRRLRKPC